ncbi:MAG: phytoene desaturase family protein, partial [Dehalococcoidia bacterium]
GRPQSRERGEQADAPGSVWGGAYYACSQFSKPENVGIPRGSMGGITQAMANSAESMGVEIRTGALVEKIIVEKGAARGVKLAGGEEIRSFIVVSNADPQRTYLTLVDQEHLEEQFIRRVKNLSVKIADTKLLAALRELPDFSAYLGKDYDPRRATHIRINPSMEYGQKSYDDAMAGKLTDCPTMGVQIPSLYDPSLAPSGHHVLSADCHAYPGVLKEGSWEDASQKVGEQLIDVLTQYAPNFRDSIIHWTVQTPRDIEIREAMTNGNLHHIDDPPHQRMAGRMPYRAPVKQLYLCGSGTHPGGEVTGAPGHNAAKAILKDLEREVVSRRSS